MVALSYSRNGAEVKPEVFLLGPFVKFGTALNKDKYKPASWKKSWENPKTSEKQNDDEAIQKLDEWYAGHLGY